MNTFFIVKGSPPKPSASSSLIPSSSSSSSSSESQLIPVLPGSPQESEDDNSSRRLCHEDEILLTTLKNKGSFNLNRAGSIPELPRSSAATFKRTPMKVSSSSSLMSTASSESKKSKMIIEEEEENSSSSSQKYKYHSTLYLSSMTQVQQEYEHTIHLLRKRLNQLLKERKQLEKTSLDALKTHKSLSSGKKRLQRQVASQRLKLQEQLQVIVQQKQAFEKLSERYSNLHQYLHEDDQHKLDEDPQERSEKGIKALLRTLSRDYQDSLRQIKMLERSNGDLTQQVQSCQHQRKKLQQELSSLQLLSIATSENTSSKPGPSSLASLVSSSSSSKNDLEQQCNPRLLHVLQSVDSTIELQEAVTLAQQLHHWTVEIPTFVCSGTSELMLQRILRMIVRIIPLTSHVQLYRVDHVQKLLLPLGERCGHGRDPGDSRSSSVDNEDWSSSSLSFAEGELAEAVATGDIRIQSVIMSNQKSSTSKSSHDTSQHKPKKSPKRQRMVVPILDVMTNLAMAVTEIQIQDRTFSRVDEIMLRLMNQHIASILHEEKNRTQGQALREKATSLLYMPSEIVHRTMMQMQSHRSKSSPEIKPEINIKIDLMRLVHESQTYLTQFMMIPKSRIFIGHLKAGPQTTLWYPEYEISSLDCASLKLGRKSVSVDSGVAGYVYRTGEACFLDSGADSVHFNDTVDLNTGKGGLFTLPLQTLSHEIIGVIQCSQKPHDSAQFGKVESFKELLALFARQLEQLLMAQYHEGWDESTQ